MTRRSSRSTTSKTSSTSTSTENAATPVQKEEVAVVETAEKESEKPSAPKNIETPAPSDAPEKPAEKAPAEKIQTDVREKLANKSTKENAFVPTNPVALEKAAKQVAEEQGFELNRGTSVGARLLARAQKNNQ